MKTRMINLIPQRDDQKRCDICNNRLLGNYVDGKTFKGPWANMCLSCYKKFGIGIGKGKGQMYNSHGEKVKG